MKSKQVLIATSMALIASCSVAAAALSDGASAEASATPTFLIAADYPSVESAEELVDVSDAVVQGTVTASRVEELYPDLVSTPDPRVNPQYGLPASAIEDIPPVITTVFTIAVTDVIKGDVAAGSTIEVSQLGGEYNGAIYELDGGAPIEQGGAEYVLALAAHGPSAPFDLSTGPQSAFTVETDGALVASNTENDLDMGSVDALVDAAAASS